MSRFLRLWVAVSATCLAHAGNLRADHFRVEAGLVLVRMTVTDHRGANVLDLQPHGLTVLDDGRPQPITTFYRDESACSIGFVLDVSGSMRNLIGQQKQAVRALIADSHPEDEFFATILASSPAVLSGITTDSDALESRVRHLHAGGSTALLDGIQLAGRLSANAQRACRALVVISDGGDNHSQISKRELIRDLAERDVQVYTISMAQIPAGGKASQLAEVHRGLNLLEDVASDTGGFNVRVDSGGQIAAAVRKIGEAMRNRYVLGFRRPECGSGEMWHRIQVKTNGRKLNVNARSGYGTGDTVD